MNTSGPQTEEGTAPQWYLKGGAGVLKDHEEVTLMGTKLQG